VKGEPGLLRESVIAQLKTVIDPETGADVWRTGLVEDLAIGEYGHATYRFHPSSPFCPLAVMLGQNIKEAVGTVPGITHQTITVEGYVKAEMLTQLLSEEG
jgi:metal-sulfur cluster biosynthetic enzyme